MKNSRITLVTVKKDLKVQEFILSKLKEEYLFSFMTRNEFSIKYSISDKAIKYILKVNNLSKDMSKYSSSKKEEIKEKRRATCIEKYGKPYANNREKYKETMQKRYGVDAPLKVLEFKEKSKETFNKNYSKDSEAYKTLLESRTSKRNETLKSIDFKDKIRESRKKHQEENPNFTANSNLKRSQTTLLKYGVVNISKNQEISNKKRNTYNKRIKDFEEANSCTQYLTLINTYGRAWLKIKDSLQTLYNKGDAFIKNEDIPKIEAYCSRPHIIGVSEQEKELLTYVSSLCSNIIENDRSIIAPKELDIYIPSKKVAIEFNGLYWHSKYDKTYHLNKTLECEKKGIRLIHIWEDLWESKQDIYKSIIASALGVYERRIYARNCECKEISSEEYRDFLERNHIQGSINSSIRLGLFYESELVQVAGWGKSRFKKDEMELHRMCSKLNTQVIGGFSKLIKHSNLKKFISYVDRSLYDGKGYEASGFTIIGTTPPSYFYYRNGRRLNRIQAQKHKLGKLLENFDASLSETENMLNNKYIRIFDCGNLKVVFNIS